MLGLDAAGKTTILYKLHIGEVLSTVPTLGEWIRGDPREISPPRPVSALFSSAVRESRVAGETFTFYLYAHTRQQCA